MAANEYSHLINVESLVTPKQTVMALMGAWVTHHFKYPLIVTLEDLAFRFRWPNDFDAFQALCAYVYTLTGHKVCEDSVLAVRQHLKSGYVITIITDPSVVICDYETITLKSGELYHYQLTDEDDIMKVWTLKRESADGKREGEGTTGAAMHLKALEDLLPDNDAVKRRINGLWKEFRQANQESEAEL